MPEGALKGRGLLVASRTFAALPLKRAGHSNRPTDVHCFDFYIEKKRRPVSEGASPTGDNRPDSFAS